MALEYRGEQPLRCTPQTLLNWVRRTKIDQGTRDGVANAERERVTALEREIKELSRANEINKILKLPSAFFSSAQHRPPIQSMKEFVNQHRDHFGGEPIRKVLQIAPSGYRRYAAQKSAPLLRCDRTHRDKAQIPQIKRVWHENM